MATPELDLTTEEGKQAALKRQIEVERIRQAAQETVRAERSPGRPAMPLSFDGEEDLRPSEYLVAGVIPEEGAGMLFAETDLGKTTITLDMSVHIAAGLRWHGLKVKRGTVVFVETEGGRSFALRKHAAKGAAGLGDSRQSNLEGSLPFVTSYAPLSFGPDTDLALVLAQAASIKRDIESRDLPPVRLVVADTLAQNIAGDVDSNVDMTAFLKMFRAFVKALSDEPVFGLLIHHPGHKEKGRARGAYSLEADLDLVMELKGTQEALTLSCKRMRNDSRFEPISLKLVKTLITVDGEPLKDTWGKQQTALVVMSGATSGAAPAPAVRRVDEVETAVLDALPEWPKKVGVQAHLVPAVSSRLGRKVSKDKVMTVCFTLQLKGLAESAPGRQKDSLSWGRSQVVDAGDM